MNTSPRSAIAYLAKLDGYKMENHQNYVVLYEWYYGMQSPYDTPSWYWKPICRYNL